MSDQRRDSERSREISAIKKQGRKRRGRGVPLPGLWACRTAAGLTQRELAMLVGSSQGTITSLEHMSRGAYPEDPPPFVRSVEGGDRRPALRRGRRRPPVIH